MTREEIIDYIKEHQTLIMLYSVDPKFIIYRTIIINKSKRIPESQPILFKIPLDKIDKEYSSTVELSDVIDFLE